MIYEYLYVSLLTYPKIPNHKVKINLKYGGVDMNIEFIKNHLNEYNEDEIFYRNLYNASKTPVTYKAFLNSLNMDDVKKRHLIVPDVAPDIIPQHMEDIEYFDLTREKSVYLSKHNRYTPVFKHRHDFFEMVYVLSGSCTQTIGENRIIMTSGDLCLISENISHTIEVFDDSIIINILLRRSTFDDIFFNVLRNKGIISSFFIDNLYSNRHIEYIIFHTKNDVMTETKILEMYAEQFVNDEYSDRIINNILCLFFTYLMRLYRKTAELPPACTAAEVEKYKIVNYIQDHYSTVTLDSVSAHFNFSTPYCSKLIKSTTGHTFSELLRMVRMRRSEIMLRSTQMSIANISSALGYENPESFIRVFKKQYGMSPSQYRNNIMK